jgi:hypothetical protein
MGEKRRSATQNVVEHGKNIVLEIEKAAEAQIDEGFELSRHNGEAPKIEGMNAPVVKVVVIVPTSREVGGRWGWIRNDDMISFFGECFEPLISNASSQGNE